MKIIPNTETHKVKLLQNDNTLILEGTWKEVEDKIREILYPKEEREE